MRRSLIADVSQSLLFHGIMVLSVYFLFVGHNQPGGGFVGGLVAGIALALRFVVGGTPAVRETVPVPPWIVLGIGLCLSALTAMVPIVLGHGVLDHAAFEWKLPLLGKIKATSALPFDIGVYLVVVGVALTAFAAFGEDSDEHDDTQSDPQSDTDDAHGEEVAR